MMQQVQPLIGLLCCSGNISCNFQKHSFLSVSEEAGKCFLRSFSENNVVCIMIIYEGPLLEF